MSEKFTEKQSTKSFLVGKNNVSKSLDIFNRYGIKFMKYDSCYLLCFCLDMAKSHI